MSRNISCLFALALGATCTLIAIPCQAETASETNMETTSYQPSITDLSTTPNFENNPNLGENLEINISQLQRDNSSEIVNTPELKPERNYVYSRIGFGLKQ